VIARPPPVRGVVLILIDSLRGDRLDARRGGQPLTPNLTRLARRSALFPNAYTPAPGTTAALTELLSDQFAAALRDAGIRTAAVAGQANLARFAPMFEWFDDSAAIERREAYKNALTSEAIAGRAAAALDALAGADRFFLVAHFFDPHAHYVGNPAFDFGRGEAARYDAEVAYTDRWLGGLVDRVVEAGDLALIVTSDHGDELWEHRYKRHQLRLYDESTRVPIVAFHPRGVGGESFGAEVSLVDVAPTTLDMLGIGGARVPGRSLWPAIAGAAPPAARPIGLRSTSGALWGVVSGRRKLIFDRHRGILEYYDLEHDPGERRNLAGVRPDAMKPLACALDQHMKVHGL
jgi:arylsulfatase A-like enzyme